MSRRSSYLAAFCTGAFVLGTFLGIVAHLPSVNIQSAYAAASEQAPAKAPSPDPNKGSAGARCKVTKDCQQSLVCTQVGDHKECTVPPLKVPESPVVT